jgi:hypothetical protein
LLAAAGLLALLGAALPVSAANAALASDSPPPATPNSVTIAKRPDGGFSYSVDGKPQVFIGMGYNPIYRNLSDADRAANYRRDFQMLRDAGVNTITGWDADKGYEQDKFDELTLSIADEFGIGVVMPLNLPPEGDYQDPAYVSDLIDQAQEKIARFKGYHALRMWGVGNEVLWEEPPERHAAFLQAYFDIADVFHQLDPSHPVIYREAEDRYVPELAAALRESGDLRPWLLYGANIYNHDPKQILADWPDYGLDRPMLVSEFGTQGDTPDARARGYVAMWQSIRCFDRYVLGGAPYAWTVAGPEPTDTIWGLMNDHSQPVDGTFGLLSQAWANDHAGGQTGCQQQAAPVYVPPSQPVAEPRPPAPAAVKALTRAASTAGASTKASPSAAPAPAAMPTAAPQPSPSPAPARKPTAARAPSPSPSPRKAPAPSRTRH